MGGYVRIFLVLLQLHFPIEYSRVELNNRGYISPYLSSSPKAPSFGLSGGNL